MSKLAKFREKVQAKKPLMVSKPKPVAKTAEAAETKEVSRSSSEVHAESTMSETTVFLLMDRFVPW